MNVQLFIIDGQVDFMDSPGSALPVTGANADMERLAKMIDRKGRQIDEIHATADSHQEFDIAHPMLWVDQKGNFPPALVTVITSSDIEAGIWRPRKEQVKPFALGGQTLGQYALSYAKALEKGGRYPLIIWPPHCIIGSPGHNFQPALLASFRKWCRDYFATINVVTKGSNPFTEHYGALKAEVPLPSDPSTGLRTDVLDALAEADIVGLAGEASSHCVMSTVDQIADNIGEQHIKKFHILTDCTSPVGGIPGLDFPQIAQDWMQKMKKRGMVLTTSDKFLA